MIFVTRPLFIPPVSVSFDIASSFLWICSAVRHWDRFFSTQGKSSSPCQAVVLQNNNPGLWIQHLSLQDLKWQFSATRRQHSEVKDSSEVWGQVQWSQWCRSGVIGPVQGKVGPALGGGLRYWESNVESDTYGQHESWSHEDESPSQDQLRDRQQHLSFGVWRLFARLSIPLSSSCICVVGLSLMTRSQPLILRVDRTVAICFRGFFSVQLGLQGRKKMLLLINMT